MAKTALTLTLVTCSDKSTDYMVGLNKNTNTNDKVQAFVDAFRDVASSASETCYGLPQKAILALWGAEYGWGTGSTQQKNQNADEKSASLMLNPQILHLFWFLHPHNNSCNYHSLHKYQYSPPHCIRE